MTCFKKLLSFFYVLTGCTTRFQSEDENHPLSTLDFSVPSSKGIPYLPNKPVQCTVTSVEYLLNTTWKQLPKKDKDSFSLEGISGWVKNELRVCAYNLASIESVFLYLIVPF